MIEIRTSDELRSDLLAALLALCPRINTGKDTDEGALVEMLLDGLRGLQYQVKSVEDDLFVQTASTEALDLHADAHFFEGRKAATTTLEAPQGLRAVGTPGATVPAASTLVHQDGTRYQVTETATVDAAGEALCALQSITTGRAANKSIGEFLTFESPPPGVESEATLYQYQMLATDEETDAELVVRLLDVIRNPHAGGRCSDYRQWAMEVPRILAAFVYAPSSVAPTGRRGLGTVDVATVMMNGTGSTRIPYPTVVQDVQDYLDERRPAGVKEVLALRPAAVGVDFDIQLEAEHGYEFDWSLGGAAFTVLNYVVSTLTMTWSAAPPAAVIAGVRLIIDGEEFTVVSRVGSDTVLNKNPTWGVAIIGSDIYPAGPLTVPVQTAIKSLMDALGPARGVAADPEQVGWEDTLRLSQLFRAILSVQGVREASIVAPVANQVPADLAPAGTVQLLVYDMITVRPA